MGMFDEIWIDNRTITTKDIRCSTCNNLAKNLKWQTKAFHNIMEDYFLTDTNDKGIRLFKLDEPCDKTFWHGYTDKETEEWNEKLEENHGKNTPLYNFWKKENGNGHWKDAAYYPQNRISRSMGDLPHQIIRVYTSCSCITHPLIELEIKFTDGKAIKIERV